MDVIQPAYRYLHLAETVLLKVRSVVLSTLYEGYAVVLLMLDMHLTLSSNLAFTSSRHDIRGDINAKFNLYF